MDIKVLLEEYRTLREELLLHYRLSRQAIVWMSTAFVALVGLFLKFEPPVSWKLASSVHTLLLIPFLSLYQHERTKIIRIASYLEVCIEPHSEELNWSGRYVRSKKVMQVKGLKRQIRMCLQTLLGVEILFFIFGFLSVLIPWIALGSPTSGGLRRVDWQLVVMVGLNLYYVYRLVWFFTWPQRREKVVERWRVFLQQERGDGSPLV